MQAVGGLGAAPRQEVTLSSGALFEMRLAWECSRDPEQLRAVTSSSPWELSSLRVGDLGCALLPWQQRWCHLLMETALDRLDSLATLG